MSETAEEIIRRQLGKSGGWKKGSLGATEANEKVRTLEGRLNIDPLTGLESEYPLHDMLEGLQGRWQQDYRKGEFLKGTFVVADLDGLHNVNHKYGKIAGGNDYLKAAAQAIMKVARGNGRCFRSRESSDEFLLYLPGFKVRSEIETVLDVVDMLLEGEEKRLQDKYPGIKFGLSYTVASFHRAYPPKDAFDDANDAMGKAKTSETGERVGNVGRIFVNELKLADQRYE